MIEAKQDFCTVKIEEEGAECVGGQVQHSALHGALRAGTVTRARRECRSPGGLARPSFRVAPHQSQQTLWLDPC